MLVTKHLQAELLTLRAIVFDLLSIEFEEVLSFQLLQGSNLEHQLRLLRMMTTFYFWETTRWRKLCTKKCGHFCREGSERQRERNFSHLEKFYYLNLDPVELKGSPVNFPPVKVAFLPQVFVFLHLHLH